MCQSATIYGPKNYCDGDKGFVLFEHIVLFDRERSVKYQIIIIKI